MSRDHSTYRNRVQDIRGEARSLIERLRAERLAKSRFAPKPGPVAEPAAASAAAIEAWTGGAALAIEASAPDVTTEPVAAPNPPAAPKPPAAPNAKKRAAPRKPKATAPVVEWAAPEAPLADVAPEPVALDEALDAPDALPEHSEAIAAVEIIAEEAVAIVEPSAMTDDGAIPPTPMPLESRPKSVPRKAAKATPASDIVVDAASIPEAPVADAASPHDALYSRISGALCLESLGDHPAGEPPVMAIPRAAEAANLEALPTEFVAPQPAPAPSDAPPARRARAASPAIKRPARPAVAPAPARAMRSAPPLSQLPGIGPGMIWRLESIGYKTMADLAEARIEELNARLGAVGRLVKLDRWIEHAREQTGKADDAA